MAKREKRGVSAPVETILHRDKRKNIPTEELRDFVADAEEQPKVVLDPRDPSLDPQLVWKGKDEPTADAESYGDDYPIPNTRFIRAAISASSRSPEFTKSLPIVYPPWRAAGR